MPSLLIFSRLPADSTIILLLDRRGAPGQICSFTLDSLNTCSKSRPSLSVYPVFIATAKSRCVSAGAQIGGANGESVPTRAKKVTASVVRASEPSAIRTKSRTCFRFQRSCERRVITSVSKNHRMPSSVFFVCWASSLSHLRSNYPDSFSVTATGSCSLFTLLHIVPCTLCIQPYLYCQQLQSTDLYINSFPTSFPDCFMCS